MSFWIFLGPTPTPPTPSPICFLARAALARVNTLDTPGGQRWSKVVKGGQRWSKVVKGGQRWSKVVKTWLNYLKKIDLVENFFLVGQIFFHVFSFGLATKSCEEKKMVRLWVCIFSRPEKKMKKKIKKMKNFRKNIQKNYFSKVKAVPKTVLIDTLKSKNELLDFFGSYPHAPSPLPSMFSR